MSSVTRDEMLARIRSNILQHGHHVYVVRGQQPPRFTYSIGLSPVAGAELVMAGASVYSTDEVKRIVDEIAASTKRPFAGGARVDLGPLGTFRLGAVDASWVSLLLLGALDYYGQKQVPALQIVPDDQHWTLDIPDLSKPWRADAEPAWSWLQVPWPHPVPDTAVAITNLDALRGRPVTEVMRWEENQWEMFAGAGPDVPRSEIREVPLGTLLALDPSLAAVVGLRVGKGLWRDRADLVWHDWG